MVAKQVSSHALYMRDWRKRNPENADYNRQKAHESRLRRIDEVREYDNQRPRRRDSIKDKARQALNHELYMGRITRPDSCDRCHESPGPMHDGRSAIQAHHEDYTKPLDVEWICVTCHGKEHRKWT